MNNDIERIDLGNGAKRKLISEFETNKATIINALSYKSSSYLAKQIRKRSKELLFE